MYRKGINVMLDFIAVPMGHILKFIYQNISFGNYGVAIILFTLLIKAILVPLYVKQYRSTSKMSEMQPQMQALQKKYANDPQTLNAEMSKLYSENRINPAGGCLPLLIQMPILFSLYYVISQPLKYMFGKSAQTISLLFKHLPQAVQSAKTMPDLSIISYYNSNPDQLSSVGNMLSKNELLNMNFLGINLGAIPSLNNFKLFMTTMDIHSLGLFLIPIIAAVTTYISIKFSNTQNTQPSSAGDNPSAMAMQKSMSSMMLLSPLMTGFFAFTLPAGLSLYWIIGNVFQVLQQVYMNKYVIKKVQNNDAKPIKAKAKISES